MATTADGIIYPVAGDFIAPLNAHIQALAESVQDVFDTAVNAAQVPYTPTLSGITIGNGSLIAKYSKIGTTIIDEISITFGSTTAVTGGITISGLQPCIYTQFSPTGSAILNTGNLFVGTVLQESETSISVYAQSASGSYTSLASTSASIPSSWNVSSKITIRTVRLAA
jgi:hypothetical protein